MDWFLTLKLDLVLDNQRLVGGVNGLVKFCGNGVVGGNILDNFDTSDSALDAQEFHLPSPLSPSIALRAVGSSTAHCPM